MSNIYLRKSSIMAKMLKNRAKNTCIIDKFVLKYIREDFMRGLINERF